MRFFGLFYVSDVAEAVNCSVKNRIDMLTIYARNALTLSNSLSSYGGLTVLTNNANLLTEIEPNLRCCEIPFLREIPEGIAFRSAHHKLDVFKYFELLPDDYLVLLDLDMICVSEMNFRTLKVIQNNVPLYYDISNQVVPAYGEDRILSDMQSIGNSIYEGRWAGGELIGGPPSFFRDLNCFIDPIWLRYVDCCARLHHQGDEMIVSVALEEMRHAGHYMIDAGQLNTVGRFWSGRIQHEQSKFSFFSKTYWLLHLPQDKKFLAEFSKTREGEDNFNTAYGRYLRYRLIRNWLIRAYEISSNIFH